MRLACILQKVSHLALLCTLCFFFFFLAILRFFFLSHARRTLGSESEAPPRQFTIPLVDKTTKRMADLQTSITVINPVDGKRYKMNLKGDVSRLTIRKLKSYLVTSSGLQVEEQVLKYNGVDLGDEVFCSEVGIGAGSTLTVERRGGHSEPFIASPQRHALEMETLDQQRAVLQTERIRRDEEFKRQQQSLAASLAQAEKRRLDLERERQEKEFELRRLKELEDAAEKERQRVNAVRQAEAERESLRARDLEARKNQLHAERNAQRQLEMQKLENERKKMLLAQQRAEYEAERQRLERERREHHERRLRHELEIREKEVELERQKLEADRQLKELQIERLIADEHRDAEFRRAARHDPSTMQSVVRSREPTHLGIAPPPRSSPAINISSAGATPRTSALADKQAELDRLRQQRDALEDAQRDEATQLQAAAERDAAARRQAAGYSTGADIPIPATAQDSRQLASENLAVLAQELGVPRLDLDDNNTCVVSVDDKYTLLVTYDAATERLYLYSTLTTFIPKDPQIKLRLYELLLEGSLLGRDMCGGGVGASLKNDFVLMSTSIYLPKAQPTSLKSVVPLFVDSLIKWRNRVRDFLRAEDIVTADNVSESGAQGGGSSTLPEYPMVGIEVTDGVAINGVHTTYSDGVVVVNVKGPAHRAGILPNDFIRAVNGRRITSLRDFQDVVKSLRPHAQVPFAIDRAGTQLMISVLVGSTNVKPGEGKYKTSVRLGTEVTGTPGFRGSSPK